MSFMVRALGRTDIKTCYCYMLKNSHHYIPTVFFLCSYLQRKPSWPVPRDSSEELKKEYVRFLCKAITSSLSLRKGHSEKLLAVICMLHKVHQSQWMLKALAGSQTTFLTASKLPSMFSLPLVYVVCSVHMPRCSRDELLGLPSWMYNWYPRKTRSKNTLHMGTHWPMKSWL